MTSAPLVTTLLLAPLLPAPAGPEAFRAAALVLVATPAGTPEAEPPRAAWPGLGAALRQAAVEQELMDPRETRYAFQHADCLAHDLETVRRRRAELADAPPVGDAWRLPPREACAAACEFNRRYRKNLEARLELEVDRRDAIHAVLAETDALYAVWDAARDARADFYYQTVRRHALARVRDAVGPDAFAAGLMPPAVPVWRFQELR